MAEERGDHRLTHVLSLHTVRGRFLWAFPNLYGTKSCVLALLVTPTSTHAHTHSGGSRISERGVQYAGGVARVRMRSYDYGQQKA